jgi:hypothetical protein
MKKIRLTLMVLLCTFLVQKTQASKPGYDWENPNAPKLTLDALKNYLNPDKSKINKQEPCFKYFIWTQQQYYTVLSGILADYSKIAGIFKNWTNAEIYEILCSSSTVLLDPKYFTTASPRYGQKGKLLYDGWETCGSSLSSGISVSWYTRPARTNEQFVCFTSADFGNLPLPILSDNCGNGVRYLEFSMPKKVEVPPPPPVPQDDVYENEAVPTETVEYECVYEDVTPPEIQITVFRSQPDVERVVYVNNQQQPIQQQYYPTQQQSFVSSGSFAWTPLYGGSAQQASGGGNSMSVANNQSAISNNVNDNSNVFNTNVSYEKPKDPPNTSNTNSYTSGNPASTPSSNGLGWNPVGVPGSGNTGGSPGGVSGTGNTGSPAGVPGSGGRFASSNGGRNVQQRMNVPQQRMQPPSPQMQRQSMPMRNNGGGSRRFSR